MKSPFSPEFWRKVKSQVQKLDEDSSSEEPQQMTSDQNRMQAKADAAWAMARDSYDQIQAVSDMPYDENDPDSKCAHFCVNLVAGEIAMRKAIALEEESGDGSC